MTKEEAIEVVKKNYPHVCFSGSEFESALRELIPELKESEDERIRKMLIEQMERWKKCAEDNNVEQDVKDASDAIAYLEKQKEQKPVKLNDDTEVGLDRALQIVKAAKGNLCGYQSDDGIYECCHAIQTLERILKNGIEQQPAEWSEEDEKMKQRILTHLYSLIYPNSLYGEDASECISWLKSICPQHIQDKFAEAMHVADKFEEGYKAGVYDTKAKSWKPSEQQMANLINVRDHVAQASGYWGESLSSLIDDLKKL